VSLEPINGETGLIGYARHRVSLEATGPVRLPFSRFPSFAYWPQISPICPLFDFRRITLPCVCAVVVGCYAAAWYCLPEGLELMCLLTSPNGCVWCVVHLWPCGYIGLSTLNTHEVINLLTKNTHAYTQIHNFSICGYSLICETPEEYDVGFKTSALHSDSTWLHPAASTYSNCLYIYIYIYTYTYIYILVLWKITR